MTRQELEARLEKDADRVGAGWDRPIGLLSLSICKVAEAIENTQKKQSLPPRRD